MPSSTAGSASKVTVVWSACGLWEQLLVRLVLGTVILAGLAAEAETFAVAYEHWYTGDDVTLPTYE